MKKWKQVFNVFIKETTEFSFRAQVIKRKTSETGEVSGLKRGTKMVGIHTEMRNGVETVSKLFGGTRLYNDFLEDGWLVFYDATKEYRNNNNNLGIEVLSRVNQCLVRSSGTANTVDYYNQNKDKRSSTGHPDIDYFRKYVVAEWIDMKYENKGIVPGFAILVAVGQV